MRAGLEALAVIADAVKHDDWLAHTQKFVDEWRVEAEKARSSDQVPMRPERICRELTEVLPKDAILIADTGYAALWTGTLVYLRHPTQQYFRAAGSLGWSFPASLGAKCAAPDKPVICFCGDGGFFYHLPELETARRRNIKTVTIVNNNHCLSQGLRNLNIAYEGRADQSRKGECFEYRETDFAQSRAIVRLLRHHRRQAAGFQKSVRRRDGVRAAGGDRRQNRIRGAGAAAVGAEVIVRSEG